MPAEREPSLAERWLPRPAEQALLAALVAAALAALAGYYWRHVRTGQLVEVERAEPQTAAFQLDINRAEWPEFAQLPGIGPTLARRIVDDRARRGPFIDHADLNRVRGIGPRTLERVRPYLLPLPPASNLAGGR